MSKKDASGLPANPELLLIGKALEVVTGKWKLYIILLVGEQTWRYSELNESMPAISEKVLAGELKALVALGVLNRKAYPEIPPRVEYTLSSKGRLALPILKQILEIGRIFN
jgi:DNA-binding HxlR family transcriptional regulator